MRKRYCGKCNLPVYFAELVQAAGRSWHKNCFRCAECGKFMDSRSYNDHKDQLYCNHCYKYLFGPKGVGYGIGAGVLFTASGKCKDSNERSEFDSGASSERRHAIMETNQSYLIPNFCNTTRKSGNAITSAAVTCRRCSKKVYDAEKILAGGMAWHYDKCFVCEICKKLLEPRTVCVRCGVLYCNSCYAKEFGPQGYGRGVGAGILQTRRHCRGLQW
ncbi:unnamed protein product [Cercopithifilaria johnstoni]|uniref:Cysteine-rich protein 1 n=1 Tax=Cercopithifilaria johnstoni TaxID=2874296 RepID=A0A8J2MTN0_9BILA|nr:unnamed protein product [Cercopithifilaria johnstoni]